MKTFKAIFLILSITAQLAAIIFIFIDIKVTFRLLGIYALSLIILFGLLIRERRKEKEEENKNDYRHY